MKFLLCLVLSSSLVCIWSTCIGFSLVPFLIKVASCFEVWLLLASLKVFLKSRSSCCRSFYERLFDAHFSQIWSRIISSNVPKSRVFVSSLRAVWSVSIVSCALCPLNWNLYLWETIFLFGEKTFSNASLVSSRTAWQNLKNSLNCGTKAVLKSHLLDRVVVLRRMSECDNKQYQKQQISYLLSQAILWVCPSYEPSTNIFLHSAHQ